MQLNCDADRLADSAQQERKYCPTLKRLPRLTHNRVQVHVNNVTITSKLKRNVRQIIKAKPMVEYLQTKYKWEDLTFHSIDWVAHRRAVTNNDLPDKFITKMIHNLLPTGKRVHRYKPYYDHRCPSCYQDYEDFHHVLTCHNAIRSKWQSTLLKDVRKICYKMKVGSTIIKLLVNGIQYHLWDSTMEQDMHSGRLSPIWEDQQKIGWDHLLYGRWSKKWTEYHEKSLKERNIPLTRINAGVGWVCRVMRVIWRHMHKEWKTRNNIRHGADDAERKQKEREQCIREITLYYSYRDDKQLLREHQQGDFFYSTIQEHLHQEHSLMDLSSWLCTYRPIIQRSHTQKSQQVDGTDEQEPNSEECNDGMGSQSTGDEGEFDQDCLGSLTYSPSDDGWMLL